MLVLGLVLIVLAAAATAFAFLASNVGHANVGLSAYGISLGVSPSTIFLAGAVSLLLLLAGIALIRSGARRKARERRELKRLRKQQGPSASPPASSAPGSPGSASGSGGSGSRFGTGN